MGLRLAVFGIVARYVSPPEHLVAVLYERVVTYSGEAFAQKVHTHQKGTDHAITGF